MSICMLCICCVPCVFVWEGASVHTELRNEASEVDSPSTFRLLKEWDFLRILCISLHWRDHGLAKDCTTVSSCYQGYGNPRPGRQNVWECFYPLSHPFTPNPVLVCTSVHSIWQPALLLSWESSGMGYWHSSAGKGSCSGTWRPKTHMVEGDIDSWKFSTHLHIYTL